MGNFRYEDHLRRHQDLLHERDNDRLAYHAIKGKRVRRIQVVRSAIVWLRTRLTPRPTAKPMPTHGVPRHPRPIAE
jgi:hypothetical protein